MAVKKYVCDDAGLMAEWDWEENDRIRLNPRELTHGSTKKAHWICGAGHKYVSRIDHRTVMRSSCPYCVRKLPIVGETDLATTHPLLLLEWDYAQNSLGPEEYLAGSNKKVWWKCKTCGHCWETAIVNRALANSSCPVCMQAQRGKTKTKSTILKRGSLETQFPDLAAQWDLERNAPVTPADVHGASKKVAWWKGACGHSWQASIQNRVAGTGCPICANKIVAAGVNDLTTQFPHIAREWNYDLNGDLSPDRITAHSNKRVWWICQECEESYCASVYSRTSLQSGCPVCSNRKAVAGKNDLATTHPEIALEWNYARNGNLLPANVTAGANRKAWWICEKGHEWNAVISGRKQGRGCPICAKEARPEAFRKTVLAQKGSLLANYPKIAAQWHPTKNGNLTPDKVTAGASQAVWWLCEKGHEWEAVIYSRTAGRGCPYCNNEHSTSFPEQVLLYYLSQVAATANRYKMLGREIDIYLPNQKVAIEYNGRYYHQNRKEQDLEKYEFLRTQGIRLLVIHEGNKECVDGDDIYYRYVNSDYLNLKTVVQTIADICSLPPIDIDIRRDRAKIYEQYVRIEKANSLAVKYPWLLEEWDYERNGKLTPWQISYGSKKRIFWRCQKCGYQWAAVAHSRKKSGCPCCANRVVVKGVNDLGTTHPDLAKEWDAIKNESLPETVVAGSHNYAWWLCGKGHSWRAVIKSRADGCGCPVCAGRKQAPLNTDPAISEN